jgi:hypothetical protein
MRRTTSVNSPPASRSSCSKLDPAECEQHLVLADADAQRVVLALGLADQPPQLLKRASRHVDLEAGRQGGLERRLLDAEPVGVGGDHPNLALGGRDQDPGEDGTRLVARGRPGHLLRGGDEGGGRNVHRAVGFGLGEGRKVVAAQNADVKAGVARHDLDVLLGGAQLERHGGGRQGADDVEHQAGGEDDGALAGDLGLEGNPEPDVHIGGAQLAAGLRGDELYAGQRLNRATSRGHSADGLQLCEQNIALE